MKIFLYETSIVDPYYNLAVENALCEYVNNETEKGEKICGIFLWQSDSAVVIGRHQNPMRECDMEVLQSEHVKLVRRLTGGGAVYQDLGNLNYSFISSENEMMVEYNLKIILNTLQKFGVEAVCSGRNDIITLQNRKLSGTAKRKYQQAFLLHGTLLVDIDKAMAEKCLTPSQFKLANKGIRSVKSRIINMTDIVNKCNVYDIRECMKREFRSAYAGAEMVMPDLQDRAIEKERCRLAGYGWIMGEGLGDCWIVEKNWGTVRFSVSEDLGRIQSIKYETDCVETDLIELIFDGLKGMQLERGKLLQYLADIREKGMQQEQCIDIATDLVEKIIAELQ